MVKSKKTLTLLVTILLLTFLSAGLIAVNAQNQGTVIVLPTVGGTTNPAAGTYNYPDGSTQTFTATPESFATFVNWVVSSSAGSSSTTDNPLSLPMIAGVTYQIQAVFQPIQAPPGGNLPTNMANAAIVVVLASAGGTVNPPPGTYAFDNATSLNLQATPDTGYQFSHWVISGQITSHGSVPPNLTPTDNPYNVNHGYGASFSYQAVFTPTGSPSPSPTIPEFSGVFTAVIAVALAAVALGTYAVKRKK